MQLGGFFHGLYRTLGINLGKQRDRPVLYAVIWVFAALHGDDHYIEVLQALSGEPELAGCGSSLREHLLVLWREGPAVACLVVHVLLPRDQITCAVVVAASRQGCGKQGVEGHPQPAFASVHRADIVVVAIYALYDLAYFINQSRKRNDLGEAFL